MVFLLSLLFGLIRLIYSKLCFILFSVFFSSVNWCLPMFAWKNFPFFSLYTCYRIELIGKICVFNLICRSCSTPKYFVCRVSPPSMQTDAMSNCNHARGIWIIVRPSAAIWWLQRQTWHTTKIKITKLFNDIKLSKKIHYLRLDIWVFELNLLSLVLKKGFKQK